MNITVCPALTLGFHTEVGIEVLPCGVSVLCCFLTPSSNSLLHLHGISRTLPPSLDCFRLSQSYSLTLLIPIAHVLQSSLASPPSRIFLFSPVRGGLQVSRFPKHFLPSFLGMCVIKCVMLPTCLFPLQLCPALQPFLLSMDI